MHEAFGTLLFVVVGAAAVMAVVSLVGISHLYDEIGRGGLDVETQPRRGAQPASMDAALAREVRALVEVRNARRRRRGEPPLDVAAEVARQLRELAGG